MASSTANESSAQFLRDGSVAAGLIVAVGIVFICDLFTKPVEKPVVANEVITTPPAPEPEPIPLKIMVTDPQFDDMGRLLNTLGSGFHYTTISVESLVDAKTLEKTDVLFLTCGGVPASWVDKIVGQAERGQQYVELKRDIYERARDNLRDFVKRGGTLYASDERFSMVADMFPDMQAFGHPELGKAQTVTAKVVDPGLSGLVGEQIELPFDKPGWVPAAFREGEVSILMRGSYLGLDNKEYESPLLARFKAGEGFVIFTSFHNEKVNGELATKLLKYLVFATVLAKTEAKTAEITTSGGFSTKGKSLLSATSADPSITRIYKCTKAGPLRFVLGFEQRGARLKLSVTSPDGKQHEKEGTSTFQIDIPDAAVGDWKYTITALKMPYDNFPYSLNIGAK